MASKLKLCLPVLLLLAGVGYTLAFTGPHIPAAKAKVDGDVYVLPREFLVNLNRGRFAKLTVGLVLEHHQPEAATGAEAASSKPPEGFGVLPQEALVRAAVTDALTGSQPEALTSRRGRGQLRNRILRRLENTTDLRVKQVLLPDVTVQ